jgi:glycosyltransferase
MNCTIITCTFNSERTLRGTLESVRSQRISDIEHLIIDGGSTDGTLAIVGEFTHVAGLISEPDKGLYDAMNKGIARATGAVIGILNSDDLYANSEVISQVMELFQHPGVDAVYGDLEFVHPHDTSRVIRTWRSGHYSARSFYWGWMPPHPTFFVRRSVYEKFGTFDTRLARAADYELMLRFLLKNKVSTAYLPQVLVKMRMGGLSTSTFSGRIQANREDRIAWTLNGLRPLPWTLLLKPLRKLGQYHWR